MDRSGKTALLVMACAIAFGGGIFAGYLKNKSEEKEEKLPENIPVNVVSEKADYLKETASRCMRSTPRARKKK